MSENTPFDPLSDLAQNTSSSTRTGVPLRPQGVKLINLRHNGQQQTNSLTMQIPNNDPNDRNSRPESVPVAKSYSFIPLFETTVLMGNSVQSNPSIKQFYDLYRYNNREGQSLGLYNSNTNQTRAYLKEEGYKVNHRIFGILTAIDGKSVKSNKKLEPFQNDGLLLCYMQLNPGKYRTMQDDLNANYDIRKITEHVVTVDSDPANMGDSTHSVQTRNGTTYRPHFSMVALTDAQAARMRKSIMGIATDVLKPYMMQIADNDSFLELLMEKLPMTNHGINVVDNLAEHSITDLKSLNDFINSQASSQAAWNMLQSFATQSAAAADVNEPAPNPAPAADGGNDADSANDDNNAGNDGQALNDDDLPF